MGIDGKRIEDPSLIAAILSVFGLRRKWDKGGKQRELLPFILLILSGSVSCLMGSLSSLTTRCLGKFTQAFQHLNAMLLKNVGLHVELISVYKNIPCK